MAPSRQSVSKARDPVDPLDGYGGGPRWSAVRRRVLSLMSKTEAGSVRRADGQAGAESGNAKEVSMLLAHIGRLRDPFRKARLREDQEGPSLPDTMEGANVTTSAAAARPTPASDAISVATPDDELQQAREAAAALFARWPDREATACLLRLLHESRAAAPPRPYQHIREAYAEYASNIYFSWRQVGGYLRNAMSAIDAEGARAERD